MGIDKVIIFIRQLNNTESTKSPDLGEYSFVQNTNPEYKGCVVTKYGNGWSWDYRPVHTPFKLIIKRS